MSFPPTHAPPNTAPPLINAAWPIAGRGAGGPARAHRLLRLAIGLMLVTLGIGFNWDRRWHTTHSFDTFYSPPHLFIYTMILIASLLVAVLAFAPGYREWFGPPVRLWPLRLAAPGPVFVAGAGFAGLGLAGLLDSLWHTAFGLDETNWSTPHAMLGWGWLVVCLGFLSCRLALRPWRPWRPWTTGLFALLVLGFSQRPLLGVLQDYTTPTRIAAIARLPVFAIQPAVQHTFRIELAWNLSRTNPWFVLPAALWAGAVLALLRRLLRHPATLLGFLTLWSAGSLIIAYAGWQRGDRFFSLHEGSPPAAWLPLPLLPAAATLALARWRGLRKWFACGLAGATFAALVFVTWGRTPIAALLALLAPGVTIAGGALGGWVWRLLDRPTARTVWPFVVGCLVIPFFTGVIDLALRRATP